jgi:hypothetical protein
MQDQMNMAFVTEKYCTFVRVLCFLLLNCLHFGFVGISKLGMFLPRPGSFAT